MLFGDRGKCVWTTFPSTAAGNKSTISDHKSNALTTMRPRYTQHISKQNQQKKEIETYSQFIILIHSNTNHIHFMSNS